MARRYTLVTERAGNFVDPLHAANDEALEVQLDGDAQIERHVQRIVMRDEGAGMSAAHFGMEYRSLNFDEAVR